MTDISRFFKHSSIYAVGNLLNRLGAFVLLPVYTNYLTVAEYGTLEIFMILLAVGSSILAVGMAHATLRFYFDYEDQDDRNASVSTNYFGSLAIATIGVLVISLFSDSLTLYLFESDELRLGIYLVLATLLLELSSQICLAYIRALELSLLFVFLSLAKLLIQVSVNAYLLIVEEAGIIGVLTGNLVTVVVGWTVLTIFTLRRCGIRFHLRKFLPILKYCYPFLGGTVMYLIASNADRIILRQMISLEALGIYALALKFHIITSELIGEPFSKSYGAFRYTIMGNENAGQIQADIVRYLFIFSVFAALGISLFVGDLLLVMSDPAYHPAADLVPVLMIAAILKLMLYPAETGILYAKQTKYVFYFTTVNAIVSPLSNILLIYWIGIYGACVAMIITSSIWLYLMNRTAQRYLKVAYHYRKMMLVGAVAIAFYLVSLPLAQLPVLTAFAAKLLLLAGFVVFVFLSPSISKDENEKLKAFINAHVLRRAT